MNDKTRNLPSTKVADATAVQLHCSGSTAVGALIDNALANLDQEQARTLAGKAAEEALRLEVRMREQNIDYVTGKKTVEDHVDAFALLEKQGRLTRQAMESTIKTGAGEMRITSKSGATCFVATATYGNADHPNVRFLRAWRDGYLAHSAKGRAFIAWYWRTGPRMAIWVQRYPALKALSQGLLAVLVSAIRFAWKIPDSSKSGGPHWRTVNFESGMSAVEHLSGTNRSIVAKE